MSLTYILSLALRLCTPVLLISIGRHVRPQGEHLQPRA